MANYIADPRTQQLIASMNSQHAGASRRAPATVYEPYYHNGNVLEQLIASVLTADKKPYQPDYIADPRPTAKKPAEKSPSMSDMQAAVLKSYIADPRTQEQIARMSGSRKSTASPRQPDYIADPRTAAQIASMKRRPSKFAKDIASGRRAPTEEYVPYNARPDLVESVRAEPTASPSNPTWTDDAFAKLMAAGLANATAKQSGGGNRPMPSSVAEAPVMTSVSPSLSPLQAPMPSAPRQSGRGGASYFEAGPSSQGGLDMASALLQQRLGAMGQNQNMDLMYRRDPRAATQLIQAQMAAQEEAANRAQRGDIANQEMGYRNRSLDMQGELAGADRQASMDRLEAQLIGQRGIAKDQMGHTERMQHEARLAAIKEAALQREHQTGLADKQITAQTGEGKLGRDHAAKLAEDRIRFELKMKELENSGLDNRSKAEILNTFVQSQVKAASELPAGEYEQALVRYAPLMKQFGLGPRGANGAAATAPDVPESKTAAGRFAAKYPELKASWDAASKDKEALLDFMNAIPLEDIRNNPDAVKQYAGLRYQGQNMDSELSNSWSLNPNTTAKTDAVRQAMGLEPTGNWWQDARKIGFNPLLPGADSTGAAMEWLSKLIK